MQYGRKLDFGSAGEQATALRLPGGTLTHATLDALVSNLTPGSLTFKLDVGKDGTWDWQVTQPVTTAVTLNSLELAGAFSAYTAGQAGDVDVPVKVYLSQGGQVLLTNLVATPASDVDLTLSAGDISFGEGARHGLVHGYTDQASAIRVSVPESVLSVPTEGDTIPITATLRNTGSADSGPLTAAFYALRAYTESAPEVI